MHLVPLHVSPWDTYSDNAVAVPIVGGRKYRTAIDAIGFEGIPCSAYFVVILLDKAGREISRKIRWLNDFSGSVVSYPLVFRAEPDATSAVLGYRINCESALQAVWLGRLSDLRRVRLRKAREGTRECGDSFSDAWELKCAVSERPGDAHDGGRYVDVVKDELHPASLHIDFSPEDIEIITAVKPFTMTSNERIYALVHAVHYVVDNDVPGDIVECGVWRGGSMMAAAMALLRRKTLRDLYLFDTFTGMPAPSGKDADPADRPAAGFYRRFRVGDDGSDWCLATLDEARRNLLGTGYPAERLHFVEGKVEETLPAHAPEVISVLRLDTDFYESTLHELEHLFPRLSRHGVLIVDDYGYWKGVREAVEEYLRRNDLRLFLGRVDFTGRIGVKL
ncbi:MAG TPA: TylF/MycF/NovP-related O-methyltransferase [Planctomycetota bacterium]|nr:TylF/MycF/NovP-related O-methyltransferase [Planctomycetota bacterium]HUV38048.1 TylF/MycF/NovP-related O-methyltransferase [Planctomycetota bacterium]